MANETWRERLQQALEASGKSQSAIAREAGVGRSYLNGVLVEGKEPTLANFLSLAEALSVSATWLIYGVEISADTEELLRLYSRLPAEQRADFLRLAQSVARLTGATDS